MFPSEAQAERRLLELRAERDLIDAEIAEVESFLDLGRRLAQRRLRTTVTPLAVIAPGPVDPEHDEEDRTAARQNGHRLVEAAVEIIRRAGHPLHARDLHRELAAAGFILPGKDPVAALNTRLWKRAQIGKQLRRVAEATYALPERAG